MIDMASAAPPSACEPFEEREDGNGGASLARNSRALKQTQRRADAIDLPALAVLESKAAGPKCMYDGGHDPGSEEVGYNTGWPNCETYKGRSQDREASHSRLGTGYCEALFGGRCGQYSACFLTLVAYAHVAALAQSCTQTLAMAPYASISVFLRSWIRVLAMTTMIAYADARALPPYYSAHTEPGSDTVVSPDGLGRVSLSNKEAGLETHGTSWSLWVTLAIAFVSLLGGAEAWATLEGGRVRRIRATGYACVFTLVVAAAPMVLHEAGGIEAEVKGLLLALWVGGHLNFVLRGAILVRHEQVGYLSPLGYVGVLAVFSHLIFSAADKQNSRLYTTLITLAVTGLQDVGIM